MSRALALVAMHLSMWHNVQLLYVRYFSDFPRQASLRNLEKCSPNQLLEELSKIREILGTKNGQESKEYLERFDAVLEQLDTIPPIPAALAKIVYPHLKKVQGRSSTPLRPSSTSANPEDFSLQKYIEHLQVMKELLTTESKASRMELELETPRLLKLLSGFCSSLEEPRPKKKAKGIITINQACLTQASNLLQTSKDYKDLERHMGSLSSSKTVHAYLSKGVEERVSAEVLLRQTRNIISNLKKLKDIPDYEEVFARSSFLKRCWLSVLQQNLDGEDKSPSNVFSLLNAELSEAFKEVKVEKKEKNE